MKEKWKDIVGFEGLYKISSEGRVYSLPRDFTDKLGRHRKSPAHFMKIKINLQTGYPTVTLTKQGKGKQYSIHRLIAEAFIPNPQNLPCVNHIDENRANSVLSNLEWVSYSKNNTYGMANYKRSVSFHKTIKNRIKKVIQYSLEGKPLLTFPEGISQVVREFGYAKSSIMDCCNHKPHSHTAYGFVWRYSDDPYTKPTPKKTGPKSSVIRLLGPKNEILKEFDSPSKASREFGIERHSFYRKANEKGISHIKGYTFQYIKL